MPYPYRTSLARLNFTSSKVYEVSVLLPAALWVSLRVLLGPTHTGAPSLTHRPVSRGPWVLRLVLCSALVFSSYINELPCVNESRQPPRLRVSPLQSCWHISQVLGGLAPHHCQYLGICWLCQRGSHGDSGSHFCRASWRLNTDQSAGSYIPWSGGRWGFVPVQPFLGWHSAVLPPAGPERLHG